MDERANHRSMGDEAKTVRRLASGRQPPQDRVDRNERVWPAMTGAQNVPGTKNRGANPGRRHQRFAFTANRDVRVHDRRRVGHAHVDEVRDACSEGGACGCLNRDEIDAAELRGFRRARMRRADQVHQRRTGRDRRHERRFVERVPHHGYGARRQFRFASGPCQRVHGKAAFQQLRDQRLAQVAGSAGDENWRQIELTLRLKLRDPSFAS